MGDETGLRPKAGKQREEPPDTDWVRHRQNWAEQTKEGCGWVSGGPTLHTHTLVSRTVLIDVPLTGVRRFESQSKQQYCTCCFVCCLVARQSQRQWDSRALLLRRNTDAHETTLLLYYKTVV